MNDSENYAVINGKRIKLTDEQCRTLGVEPKKDYAKMFERCKDTAYCYIDDTGDALCDNDGGYAADNRRYNTANYCRYYGIMQQRAWHETLDRLLWRASVSAGELDNPWNAKAKHYHIYYNEEDEKFCADYCTYAHFGDAYFPTRETAEEAIENIIKPFLTEHPDFKW